MLFDLDFSTGIDKIWSTDHEYQAECLKGIIKNIRRVNHNDISAMHVDYLKKQGAFFVHNHDYIADNFGDYVKDPKFGLYSKFGKCYLAGRLAIPIRMFDGSVRGFIGYSNKPADLGDQDVFIKYMYPPKTVFTKGRFFYITPEEYLKAIQDDYICIVDGIFDKIILQCMGINAVSLCGSSLTKWHEYYLHFIRNKIVVADNDVAGRRLASFCKYKFENCVEILQADAGDIDSLLRTDQAMNTFKNAFDEMRSGGFILSRKLPSIKKANQLTII